MKALGNEPGSFIVSMIFVIDSCSIVGFNREKLEAILNKKGNIDTDEFDLFVMAAFGYRAQDATIHAKTRRAFSEVFE